jgi:NhaP-type Na+/H+ or K+/H+ antiporter
VNTSDLPSEGPNADLRVDSDAAANLTEDDEDQQAGFLQLSGIAVKDANAEQLELWDDEVEKLSEHLQQRRALLEKLRTRLDQPGGDIEPFEDTGYDNNKINGSFEDQIIVPVPYYMHNKKGHADRHGRKEGVTAAVTQWYGDIIGDALKPTPHNQQEAHHAEKHDHGHIALLFLFGALILGSLLQLILDRYCPVIPYTCGLFVAGSFISWIHWMNMKHGHQWTSWYDSIDMWQAINPHLLFYVFLPALLFGDVMKLKVQLVHVCFGQIFILACPGVLIGTGLTALFGRYMMPYGWDWSICFVFGSILAATDPVAVVSLFNTLGVSPRLTMLISGESLINDGTAIVCFALALKVAQGATLQPASTAYFFAYMIIPSLVLGFCIGFLTVALISLCAEVTGESDAMIQVVVTICCGYLAFFISENEFSSSGVIATVSAGLAVAHSAWPLFVSRETVHIVWEAIEFVGNTVIFFLAGLIFMGTVLERHFGIEDLSWLLTLYLGMIVIRLIMLALLWLPLNMCGQQIAWQEATVMLWSGLRGAVSLAMGMIVDIEPGINNKIGGQVMFHVGGVAALTLIINATTTGPLLRLLGLVKTDNLLNRVSSKLNFRIIEDVKKTFAEELANSKDVRFFGANEVMVRGMVPMLQPEALAHLDAGDTSEDLHTGYQRHGMHSHILVFNERARDIEWQLVQAFREVFLRVVHCRYWQGIQDGVVPRQLLVSRVLLHSTEEAMDNTWESLKDWEIITKKLGINRTNQKVISAAERFLSRLVDTWPFKLVPQFRRCSLDFQKMMAVFVALSYLEAHAFAQEQIQLSLGRDDDVGVRVRKQVIHESTLQRQQALEFVAQQPPEFVELSKSEMLARRLLRKYIHEVVEKKESGFLSKGEADHLCDESHEALREIAHLSTTSWKDRLPQKDESPTSQPVQPPRHSPLASSGPSQVPLVDTMQQIPHGEGVILPPLETRRFGDQGAALQPGSGGITGGGHHVSIGTQRYLDAAPPAPPAPRPGSVL